MPKALNVGTRQDRMDTGQASRGPNVDSRNTGMGQWAPEKAAPESPFGHDVDGIFCRSRDLLATVSSPYAAADNAPLYHSPSKA